MNEVTVPKPKAVLKSGATISAIVPTTLEEAFRLAEAICIAGLVPDSQRGKTDQETASKVMITILKGQEVGLPPMAALSNIYIINNKPSMYGDGALAVVQKHPAYAGHKEWYEGVEGQDSWVAKCEFYRRDIDGATATYPGSFSWAQAKTAGLTRRGPWVTYPNRMLKMRSRAFGMRDGFSDALVGISIAEEIQDMPTKPAEVSTAFLDPTDDAIVVDVAKIETIKPDEIDFDPKQFLDMIKKNFLVAGDDVTQITNVIAAAENIPLPEPFQSELATILKAKRAKVESHGKPNSV